MTTEELDIALLELRQKIANCGDRWLIRNTLRQQAQALVAAFVDPTYEEPSHPPLQDSTALALAIDPACGF